MIRGCSLVSAGCSNCYAMHFAHRFSQPGGPFEGLTKMTNSGVKWTGKIKLMHEMLTIPLKWRTPRTCFVNSMTDLFHKDVPFEFIDKVFAIMVLCHRHTFQILTKRADRMDEYFGVGKKVLIQRWEDATYEIGLSDKNDDTDAPACSVFNLCENKWPRPNIWLGVSVEDQETLNDRAIIQAVPAHVRFISYEPAIGPIKLNFHIDWLIAGGESGNNARPFHPQWFRDIRDDCKKWGVPFFLKQFGKWGTRYSSLVDNDIPKFRMYRDYQHFTLKDWVNKGDICVDVNGKICNIGKDFRDAEYPVVILSPLGKHNSGNILDGVQHLEFPE